MIFENHLHVIKRIFLFISMNLSQISLFFTIIFVSKFVFKILFTKTAINLKPIQLHCLCCTF